MSQDLRSDPQHGRILVLNCGSSSVKFALFDAHRIGAVREPFWKGRVDGIGPGGPLQDHDAALREVIARVTAHLDGAGLRCIVHRVVHGGGRYLAATLLDAQVLAALTSFTPLAPLHQSSALAAMRWLHATCPAVPQIGCFDTAFHDTLPEVERTLPLPFAFGEQGLRRFGFHGLSYDYLSVILPERYGDAARGRVLAAHLGSGASLCALQNLRSVATTMGFSPLDGLMMGTRSGALDPGAVLYLLQTQNLSAEQCSHLLYEQSGLLGVSGFSSEIPALLAQEHRADATGARIRAALALYVRRIVREMGSLVAALGGVELLVFTGGVGEHSAPIRERVCRDLAFLGVKIDADANARNDAAIHSPDSRVRVVIEATNEEWIMARQALNLNNPRTSS